MKYLITESKLKSIIKDKFGIDFTGDVKEVTSAYGILNYFDECFSYVFLNRRLNNHGPMYLINIDYNFKILYQKNLETGLDWIISNKCDLYDTSDFMDLIGIRPLGITMEQFIDLYI